MVAIVPAVLAESPPDYKRDMELASSLSDRVQIDLADGRFASNLTVSLAQVYWPPRVQADLHLMYDSPQEHISTIVALKPALVIVHAEAKGVTTAQMVDMLSEISGVGIKTGLALLGPTAVEVIAAYLERIDHVMVFTGELGHYGGNFDRASLDKIAQIKAIKPTIEVGVDGGINETNAAEVVSAGADVLNVGSYLQKAGDPQAAYAKLKTAITNSGK